MALTIQQSEFRKDFDNILRVYESTLKTGYAGRTRQMMKRHGIIETINRLVLRPTPSTGFFQLLDSGNPDLTFEALVLRHKDFFQPIVVAKAQEVLESYRCLDQRQAASLSPTISALD
jgi:hypothetical protein